MSTKRPQIRARVGLTTPAAPDGRSAPQMSVREHYMRILARAKERRAFYADELSDRGARFLDRCAYAATVAMRDGGDWTPLSALEVR